MARVDYGQVPAVNQDRIGYWTRHTYRNNDNNFTDVKWIDNKYLNSFRKNHPGQALVGKKKSTGKWSILVVYEKVGL